MSKIYTCTICKKQKQLQDFYLRKTGTVGEYKCKQCLLDKRKNYYYDNYKQVRECNRKAVSEFQKRNLDRGAAKTAQYNAKKRDAFPRWLSKEDIAKIRSIYKMCRQLSKKTGIRHNVDHIVPLNGENVSGLHVPWNLQIITAEDNRKKSNLILEDIVCS